MSWRKFEEQQNAKQSSPDTSLVSRMLTPAEQEQLWQKAKKLPPAKPADFELLEADDEVSDKEP